VPRREVTVIHCKPVQIDAIIWSIVSLELGEKVDPAEYPETGKPWMALRQSRITYLYKSLDSLSFLFVSTRTRYVSRIPKSRMLLRARLLPSTLIKTKATKVRTYITRYRRAPRAEYNVENPGI